MFVPADNHRLGRLFLPRFYLRIHTSGFARFHHTSNCRYSDFWWLVCDVTYCYMLCDMPDRLFALPAIFPYSRHLRDFRRSTVCRCIGINWSRKYRCRRLWRLSYRLTAALPHFLWISLNCRNRHSHSLWYYNPKPRF